MQKQYSAKSGRKCIERLGNLKMIDDFSGKLISILVLTIQIEQNMTAK
jgi:hypothetical protein